MQECTAKQPKCTHTQEVTHSSYSSGNSLWKSQNPVGSTMLNRSGTHLVCLFKNVSTDHRRMMMPHIGCQLSHRGVFRTIKSLVCALGASSSMTEPTINSTLLPFIEQVNIYDLQKIVLQFAICFIPTLGYTYMVYTLHN